jgi:hypothetical protein
MGNKGGKELALVRSSPKGPYADEDEEFERAVARDAGWPGQLGYWWRHLRWPRAVARRWKTNNGFFWSPDFLITSLVVIVCVLCIYTLGKNWQQQQNYQKKQDRSLQAATLSVTEFQTAKSELQAALVRMQALNDEQAHDLSMLDTRYNVQRHRLEGNKAKLHSAVSDLEEMAKKTTMEAATIPGLPGEEQVHRRPHPKREREVLAPTPDPTPLLKPSCPATPSPRPMTEGMSLYNSNFTQPFKNP